jgi:DnaJ-class molecular chaperone
MKPIKSNPNEEKCPACNGTGSPPFKQPVPGRRIYLPPCKTCGGKGRLMESGE